MKNKREIIYILLANILIIFVLFCIMEFIAYNQALTIFNKKINDKTRSVSFSYSSKLPNYLRNFKKFFNGVNMSYGRLPDGLEYKGKPPIVVFGCSFAYGFFLEPNQTFSYKLAELLKRPVYNRAANAWSTHHMYYQTLQDSFYEDTQNADTYIYIMIENHLSRIHLEHFYIVDEHVYLHYNLKDGKFVMNNYKNKFSNFIRALYTRRYFNHYNSINYKNGNKKKLEKRIDLVHRYIKESKDNIESRLGKKINFIVVYFEKNDWTIPGKEILTKKLNEDGIQAFSTMELTDEDLNAEEYNMIENGHPKEAAWDLLTPLIAKKIGLTN